MRKEITTSKLQNPDSVMVSLGYLSEKFNTKSPIGIVKAIQALTIQKHELQRAACGMPSDYAKPIEDLIKDADALLKHIKTEYLSSGDPS